MKSGSICIWGLEGIPEITPGDNLAERIINAIHEKVGSNGVAEGAIFIVAQKVVSKAEGRIVELRGVEPSEQARAWAEQCQRDARMVELVLREAKRIVRMERGVLIVETDHGFVCANAGVDNSNAPQGTVILLPRNPDESARQLCFVLQDALGVRIGVIISDTFGRPWRQGLSNVALGVAGLSPFIDYRGKVDSYGRSLQATMLAVADELAAAGELVMGKTSQIPVAVIEGFKYEPAAGSGRDLIRPATEDLFR